MILLILAVAGAAGLAAGAELLPLDAAPRPILWGAALLALPALASVLGKALGPWKRRRRGSVLGSRASRSIMWARLLAFLGSLYAILYPLGWADWALRDLGWRGRPFESLVMLLVPAAALALWEAPWIYRSERRAARVTGTSLDPFPRWIGTSSRIVLVPASILLGVTFAAGRLEDLEGVRAAIEESRSLDIALCAGALAVLFAASPFLVLLAWPTASFPPGAQRERLEKLALRMGVRLRALRVWDKRTRAHLNACAVGAVPGTRAVIFTRGICDLMDDDELAAVFCHEAAHLARGHLAAYGLLALAFLFSLGPLREVARPLPGWLAWSLLAAYAGAYWVCLLGMISRRLETEADLAAASAAGFGAYLSALRKAACLLGPAAAQSGWRHLSLSRRLDMLEEASADPRRAQRVFDSCRRLRAGLFVFFLASAAGFAGSFLAGPEGGREALELARDAVEEAVDIQPLLGPTAARANGSSAIARWLGRDPAKIAGAYGEVMERAERRTREVERLMPAEAAPLREALSRCVASFSVGK